MTQCLTIKITIMRTIDIIDGIERVSVTPEELTEVLINTKGGTFGYLHMVTVPKMRKKNNPYFDRISKVTKGNVYIGGNYQKRVINETENPEFVPQKNNVGDYVSECVRYNEKMGKSYMTYEWFDEVKPKSTYMLDETDEVEKTLFEEFMNTYIPNKYGVNFQSVTISNIRELHINKVHYIVENV